METELPPQESEGKSRGGSLFSAVLFFHEACVHVLNPGLSLRLSARYNVMVMLGRFHSAVLSQRTLSFFIQTSSRT